MPDAHSGSSILVEQILGWEKKEWGPTLGKSFFHPCAPCLTLFTGIYSGLPRGSCLVALSPPPPTLPPQPHHLLTQPSLNEPRLPATRSDGPLITCAGQDRGHRPPGKRGQSPRGREIHLCCQSPRPAGGGAPRPAPTAPSYRVIVSAMGQAWPGTKKTAVWPGCSPGASARASKPP